MKGRYFKTPLALAAWSGPSGSSEKIDGKIKKFTKYNHYYKKATIKSKKQSKESNLPWTFISPPRAPTRLPQPPAPPDPRLVPALLLLPSF